MIVVDNVILSDDIMDEFFVCDIEKCKGACCAEGDLGAPLEAEELPVLERIFEEVKPYMSAEGIKAVEEQGLYVRDFEGDDSTPLVEGKHCAYALYDERGILHCAIE